MRRAPVLFFLLAAACDKPDAPRPATTATPAPVSSASARLPDVEMPERPVPRASPTVGATMGADVQMKAIGYMNAMTQPHPGDPNADADYAAQVATALKPVALSLDKGAAADKARMNRVEVIAGGRKVDIYMAGGCEAETPTRAVQNAGFLLTTLRSRGVLVVRCNDARVQCLQSTRDPTDVLCTTAPRHK